MAETLSVARRVAAEAIDEAISKAELNVYCQVSVCRMVLWYSYGFALMYCFTLKAVASNYRSAVFYSSDCDWNL